MAGCLWLIKHLFHAQAHWPGWDVPFELSAAAVAEHGGPDGREDGDFPIVDVRIPWEEEGVGHYPIRLQIADFCLLSCSNQRNVVSVDETPNSPSGCNLSHKSWRSIGVANAHYYSKRRRM